MSETNLFAAMLGPEPTWEACTYRALVEAGAPGCSWWVGGRNDPILAKDASGQTVAIVMPMSVTQAVGQ